MSTTPVPAAKNNKQTDATVTETPVPSNKIGLVPVDTIFGGINVHHLQEVPTIELIVLRR